MSEPRAEPSGAYYDWTRTLQPQRPYVHPYHQTLVMKMFLARMLPCGGSQVYLTFAQAAEVIKRLDNLTCGIPKIVYLVGWQYHGHDSKYPSWAEVNDRLRRPDDATAADSLRWLMAEGFRYNTTVSLHVNMIDAYPDSPLWDDYLAHDIIAKDLDGQPLPGEVFDAGAVSYQISYAREWETGFARKRIDDLLAALPIERAGTIHIDAFHSRAPVRQHDDTVSPYLGYPIEREVETQRRIFRYFRDRGVDVTCEGSAYWLRPDPFVGLQPMAYHFTPVEGCPPSLYCGTPMKAEPEIMADPVGLTGLLEQFCTRVVPWHYGNNPAHPEHTPVTRRDDEICMPALWADRLVLVWSREGCRAKEWVLPRGWEGVASATAYAIGVEDPRPVADVPLRDLRVGLSLGPGQGVALLRSGDTPGWGSRP